MIKLKLLFFPTFLFFCLQTKGQYIEEYPINAGNGSKVMELQNYQEAIRIYRELLKEEPDNIEFKYNLGLAYSLSTINPASGLSLLKDLKGKEGLSEEYPYYLAISYYNNYEIEKAKELFKDLELKASAEEKQKYSTWIKQCEQAIQLMKKPVNVRFENLGDKVNSDAPDFIPVVAPDESILMFSTRRNGVVGNLFDYGGYKTADIYMVKHKRNNYSRARSVGSPNTYGNELTAGISENGEYILYQVDSDDNYSDLFISEMGRRSYMPPKELNSESVNQKTKEPGGSLSNDGNVLYFSSDRPGGLGGFDLYMVKRLPNGIWAEPVNLGEPINTPGDENYPFLRGDGNELYFSSTGHPGMGKLDLFKSILNDGKWSKPVNLGFPINSPYDDYSICFTNNPRYAYVSSLQPGGEGDLDIYRLVFEDEREELCLLNGTLMSPDSSIYYEEIVIDVIDEKTNKIFGNYKSNPKSGKYNIILPPGKYSIEVVDNVRFKDYTKKIILLDKNDFVAEKKLNIVLELNPIIPSTESDTINTIEIQND